MRPIIFMYPPHAEDNMHRNAEIWAQRHEARNTAHLRVALNAVAPDVAQSIRSNASKWAERYNATERRVWDALCVAEGWRKA